LSREWEKRSQNYSPDNHSPDISQAFSNRHPAIFPSVAAGRAGLLAPFRAFSRPIHCIPSCGRLCSMKSANPGLRLQIFSNKVALKS
jgi:hypothetical protein